MVNVANAKKKSSAKQKASPRAPVKKKTPASKPGKKAAPAKAAAKKAPAKKAVAKKAPAKKAPAKKAAPKPTAKPAAKKVVAKAAPKPAAKAKPAVTKAAPPKAAPAKTPAPKTAAPKPVMKKPEPPKAAATKPVAVPTPAAAPAPAKAAKKVTPVKETSVRKKASETHTPPAQVARAATAIAKAPTHEPAQAAARPRMINLDEVKLPAGYVPSKDEEYMNPMQLLYFRNKLRNWRDELITESQETLDHLRSEIRDVGDEAERASRESDNILELRTRDRYRKLLKKIDDAIKRIEDGSYGFCEETGEDIGLARLEARPIATLTVDAQERRELFQKQFRDDR
ncbi:MAG: RNA polymerase-binding protein DksA [Proteobacteria bacterium]|nr:RNA polymerase-binding protein DksA [Pseudomonadota bacterium]